MKQYSNGNIIYSASDLVTFLECNHSTFLDVKSLTEDIKTTEVDPTTQLLQKKGYEHENLYLQQLKDEGKNVIEIPKKLKLRNRLNLNLEAIHSGADVIYQAVFLDGSWRGEADFLIKCDKPSALGDYSYEVLDTKLSRTPKPKHIIQLCTYSDMLAKVQELRPDKIYLFLGNGEKQSFKVSDFFYYYIHAKRRFEEYVKNLPSNSSPEPCSYCNFCKWNDRCNAEWQEIEHLSLVANIRSSQIEKLRKAGVNSVGKLANTPSETKIPDLNPNVFARLRSQALLQHHKKTTDEDKWDTINNTTNDEITPRGFSRMPLPNDGDLFFDMEGDPLYPNGLEYLFGVYYKKDNGKEIFKPFWAHNHEEEKESFKQFMEFLGKHLERNPNAYIYHYNHYETTALKRLACRYAVCEEQLDNLLRNHKFVDLYVVVRESIRTSEPGYSLKNLETFYMEKRSNEVKSASDSIVIYNKWIETGDDNLLQQIADYNEVDCESTFMLRNWLLKLKPEDTSWFNVTPNKDTEEKEPERKDWEIEFEHYLNRLGITQGDPPLINERLAHLLEFHTREAKSQWWKVFERNNKSTEELIDDIECLGGLELTGKPFKEKRSLVFTYHFPQQEFKLGVGSNGFNTETLEGFGTIFELDEDSCIVKIKRSKNRNALPDKLSIGPGRPIDTKIVRSAIYRYADHLLETPNNSHVATELLEKNVPRIKGKQSGKPITVSDNLQSDALEIIAELENSYLLIQGPPGTGKTNTSSHIIVELMKRGKKVGVTSNSHKAIHNLLEKVEEVAERKGVNFKGIKKSSSGSSESLFEGKFIKNEDNTQNIPLTCDLFAGTVWLFANEHFINEKKEPRLDYLFIDEAGQISTANVVAISNSSRNIVLVGDQMQLGQPIQGIHPGESGFSILEFLLHEYQTIPAERGIFINETYRLRPSICQFISDAFYDGRLIPHKSTSKQNLNLQGVDLPNEGIVMIRAEHEGCSQQSEEEGIIIREKYEALLTQPFTDKDGATRSINEDDILVVAPYNMQVNYLKSILPKDARVGTIDKFQGQQAPIVLISMATSSARDLPRGIEFLYSRNRLNVAISRAQCLAVIVLNPKLLETPCGKVEQMKLVNTFCWLDDYAKSI